MLVLPKTPPNRRLPSFMQRCELHKLPAPAAILPLVLQVPLGEVDRKEPQPVDIRRVKHLQNDPKHEYERADLGNG